MVQVYTDGACWPTGAQMGIGVYIPQYEQYNTSKRYKPKPTNTSNTAEYLAVKKALLTILGLSVHEQVEEFIIFTDSQLVQTQMSGKAEIKNGQYVDTALECEDLLLDLLDLDLEITFAWIPRKENKIADQLSRECLK